MSDASDFHFFAVGIVEQEGRRQKTRKQKRRSLLNGVFVKYGAGNETRTRDPDLGKVVLYQLSYSRKWRPLGDSNPCYRRERAVS